MRLKIARASMHDALNDIIIQGRVKRSRKPGLHASDILQGEVDYFKQPLYCGRYSVLCQHYTGDESVTDPYQIAVFRLGEKIHDMVQEWLQVAGVAEAIEFQGNHDMYTLQFTPDFLATIRGQAYLGEIKGYNQATWQKYYDAGVPPHDAHVQTNLYLHLMRVVYRRDDLLGLILMINKNTIKDKERGYKWYESYVVEYDSAMVAPYEVRLQQIMIDNMAFVGSGELPQRICESKDSKRALKCPLRDVCFSSPEYRKGLLTNGK